jgi:hypothetical protein
LQFGRIGGIIRDEGGGSSMNGLDTFKTYNPVTLSMGCLWVAVGFWVVFELIRHGTRTAIGGAFIFVLFVFIPIGLGAAIIQNQLRLRKHFN